MLVASEQEKRIASPRLTGGQRKKLVGSLERTISDMEFCELWGRTLVYYGKGNQQGTEFLPEPAYDVSLTSFLEGLCPPPRS